jgi:acyl dehydratase
MRRFLQFLRHGRTCSGHPRLLCSRFKDVGARDKPGHDELRRIDCRSHAAAIPLTQGKRQETDMTDFDPAQHRMVREQRWFEDFVIGERFVIPSRTQTSAVFAAFQTASGDTHPIHYDVEYCRARGMPDLLAHGFQTLVHTAPGAGLFPYIVEESLVGFLEQSSRFLKPVYAGDTIYPALEVTELVPGRTTGVVTLRSTVFNQRKELVLDGMQKFLVRRRPA